MTEPQGTNEAACGRSDSTEVLATVRKIMYSRTLGLTCEKSDELRVWIDATLAEVKRVANA